MVEDINSVQNNIITLLPPLRVEFGEFRFALEATNYIPNQYRIKVFRSFSSYWRNILPKNGMITFTGYDKQYPLPNPTLLQIHAAIANILNAAGRGELIERILRKYEDAGAPGKGLAEDGSTDIAHLLSVSPLSTLASSLEDKPQL
jgi:hypothetical protein